ncbi:uncharacterized protein LOC144487623 [Mustelus asterias]
MYGLLLGRDSQLGMPTLLALMSLTLLLPVPGYSGKPGRPSTCCQRYEERDFNPKLFKHFKKSYQTSEICGSLREAVVFNLKDGRKMCVDPQKAWAKLLMKRIDRATTKPQLGEKGRAPTVKVPVGTGPVRLEGDANMRRSTRAPGTQQDSTPMAAVIEPTTQSPGTSTRHQDSSKTSTNTVQAEGMGFPTSEGQTTGSPTIAEGDANKVNPTGAPGTAAPTSMAAVPREATHPLTTFPGEQGYSGKPGRPSPCCQRYEKSDINPKFFNHFKKSYQTSEICGSLREAVVFNLKDGRKMCVDPQKAWAKLLMKRIDRGYSGKPGRPSPCCQRYEKSDINPKFFNHFKKSYQTSEICGSLREAVVFNLKDGRKMCVDPQKAWAKLLMKRIDRGEFRLKL